MKTTIGSFLIDRLCAMGVKRVYGVPGDYNLEFLELFENSNQLPFIGTCNELNASYAADGDARIDGLSVVLTTYGVGDLAALPGIAGSAAEGVPVLLISGAPPLEAIRTNAILHHSLADGNFSNVRNAFREFTVAQALITPENAVAEIDRVLKSCWRERKPTLLQLPSDICYTEIEIPDAPFDFDVAPSDTKRLQDAVAALSERLLNAKRPIALVDSMVRSHGLAGKVEGLVNHFNIPFATPSSAKAVLSEANPLFMGIYGGRASASELFARVAAADCILSFGTRFVDATSGWFSQSFDPDAMIEIHPYDVRIGREFFAGVRAADLIAALVALPTNASPAPVETPRAATPAAPQGWSQDAFWSRISQFIAPNDVIVAENGTSLAGLTKMRLPEGCSFVSQPIWGAIGYTLPSLLGTLMAAPQRRHLLFIGDGSFQLTAQELSTILRHELKPIIFLINNQGYTIERLILGETASYNDVAGWRYSALPHVFAPATKVHTAIVRNMDELEGTLAESQSDALTFIEVMFERMDCPTGMAAFGKTAREYDYGHWAPAE